MPNKRNLAIQLKRAHRLTAKFSMSSRNKAEGERAWSRHPVAERKRRKLAEDGLKAIKAKDARAFT